MKFYSKKKELKNKILKFINDKIGDEINIGIGTFYINQATGTVWNPAEHQYNFCKLPFYDYFIIYNRTTSKVRYKYFKLVQYKKTYLEQRKIDKCTKQGHVKYKEGIRHNFGTGCVLVEYCSNCKIVISRVQTLNTVYNFLPIEKCDTDYFTEFGVLSNRIKLTHLNV